MGDKDKIRKLLVSEVTKYNNKYEEFFNKDLIEVACMSRVIGILSMVELLYGEEFKEELLLLVVENTDEGFLY